MRRGGHKSDRRAHFSFIALFYFVKLVYGDMRMSDDMLSKCQTMFAVEFATVERCYIARI